MMIIIIRPGRTGQFTRKEIRKDYTDLMAVRLVHLLSYKHFSPTSYTLPLIIYPNNSMISLNIVRTNRPSVYRSDYRDPVPVPARERRPAYRPILATYTFSCSTGLEDDVMISTWRDVVALLCSARLKNKCSVQREQSIISCIYFTFLLFEVSVPICALVTHHWHTTHQTFVFFPPQTNAWKLHSSI